MQLSNLATVLAIAATARALPSAGAITPRTGDPVTRAECINNNNTPVCCAGLLGSILCLINLLGDSCSADQYCCTVEGDHVSLLPHPARPRERRLTSLNRQGSPLINIDLDLLNCVELL